jgi:hypothetical protein
LSKGVFEDIDELCKSNAEIARTIACFIFLGLSFLFGQQLEMQLPGQFAAFRESADHAIQSIVKTFARGASTVWPQIELSSCQAG